MYVAVKGGEAAIDNAHKLLAERRRGDPGVPELTVDQIKQQMTLAVDRVMTEGSLYDRDLAALAIKQARGDLIEAIFLLRAYRNTLSRFADSLPIDTADVSPPPTKMYPAAKSWGRPSIIPTACSISPWRPKAGPRRRNDRHRRVSRRHPCPASRKYWIATS